MWRRAKFYRGNKVRISLAFVDLGQNVPIFNSGSRIYLSTYGELLLVKFV